jgi:hypothetical protein
MLYRWRIRSETGTCSTNSKSAWERFSGSTPWKKEHAFEEKVAFSDGGEQGIFMEYASQDGRTLKALRLRDKKVCVTDSRT